MGLSDKENSSFPKETETRVRPGSQLAPENKTTESAASGHAAVKTTPKKARSKKRADKAADDHTGNYAARITPKAYETLVPGDIPEFEDTPERRALVEKRKKGRFMRRLRDWGIFTGYLTPSFLGVLLFFFLPLIMLLFTSFQKSPTNTDFVGFRNYERVLTNDAFIAASKNTSVVLIWQVFFSYNGVINGWTAQFFQLDKIDWLKSQYAQIVIMLLFLWKNLGYNMVLFLAALNAIPGEILESASLDGAGPVKRFFAIKLHYLSPTIFFVGIMSLINSFKIFREVYLLTGDYPFDNLYMLQHFMNNKFTQLDYSLLSSGAIVMCIAMIIIVGVLFYAESRFDSDVEE